MARGLGPKRERREVQLGQRFGTPTSQFARPEEFRQLDGSKLEKEKLAVTGEDAPVSHLLLCVMGAFASFERDLICERRASERAL